MIDVDWESLLAAALVSYWIGAISPAAIAARIKKADLRGTGSGNPGATNAARAMGTATGVLVGVLDVLKGFLPALFFSQYPEPSGQVAGLAAVLGHITSPFLGGMGGKGVATALGAILAVQPVWVVPMLVAFGITVRLTRRMGIGSVAGALTLVPMSVILWTGPADFAFALVLTVLILSRHTRNIGAFVAERTGASRKGGAGTGTGSTAGGAGSGSSAPGQPGRAREPGPGSVGPEGDPEADGTGSG